MPPVLRIIDANANRAREALRVMEEAARFLLDDEALTGELKQLRHDFAAALGRFDALDFHRDTPGDVGTTKTTEAERTRDSAAAVVIAAGKRLGEALRAIEEYGKTIDADFASTIESLRYRGYEVEQRLNLALGAGIARQWTVCILFSESLCVGQPWPDVAKSILQARPDCIQLREKDLDDDELLRRAQWLVQHATAGTSVIINDRPDIALLSGAHGVHVGQGDLSCADVRRLAGRQLIVGVSTSNLEEAKQAQRDGADYCGVGPMFPSTTKPKDEIAGPSYLREYVEWNGLPHLAIGGITPANIGRLVEAGARGVAVSSAVCTADDPAEAIGRLQLALRPAAAMS
ncbi:MAG: thiamine phosphate synthase [Planctomycetota bacterium]|jgi:thiamine-phosphate pyrophosphorylase